MKTEDEQLCESLWDTALDCWDMHFCALATTGFLDLSADPTVRWLRPHPISYSHKMCVCDFSLYQFCFFRKSWLIQTVWGTWSSLAEKRVSQLPEEGRHWYLLTQGSWLSALPSGHPEGKANENLQSQMWVHLAEGLTLWTWPTFWTRILIVITIKWLNHFQMRRSRDWGPLYVCCAELLCLSCTIMQTQGFLGGSPQTDSMSLGQSFKTKVNILWRTAVRDHWPSLLPRSKMINDIIYKEILK